MYPGPGDAGPTRVRIEGGSVGAPVEVYVGSADLPDGSPAGPVLVYSGGSVETVDTLRDEVHQARACVTAVRALGRMLAELRALGAPAASSDATPATCRAAYAAGLESGLAGDAPVRLAGDGQYRLPPPWSGRGAREHETGWRTGDMVRRVVEMAAPGAPGAPGAPAAT